MKGIQSENALRWVTIAEKFLLIAVIPILAWLYQADKVHIKMKEFMSTGGRVYSSSGEATSTDQLTVAITNAVMDQIPTPEQVLYNKTVAADIKETKAAILRIEDHLIKRDMKQ